MLGERYVVVQGDSLWRIAARQLGSGRQWPLLERAKKLQSPVSFKYRLDMRWPAQDVGTAILEARMTGDLVLMSKRVYPATYVTKSDIEHQITTEANHAFGKLVSDNRFIYDASEKRLTYRSLLVSQSKTPNVPATALGVEMSSNSPIPKLRAEIRIAKLDGSFGGFLYVALDQKLVVEITPKPQPPTSTGGSNQPVVTTSSSRVAEASNRSNALAIAIGAGIIVAADLLVLGALVDDFIPIVGGFSALQE